MNERVPRTSDCLRDHLLIATPALQEGFFARSVTYICEHGESGAMGIVINQALDVSLSEILEHLDIEVDGPIADDTVLAGGPVQVDHGFVLHEANVSWESTLKVSDTVGLTTSRDVLAAIAAGGGPSRYLVALGYAGWAAGQLEEELADNAWLTVRADTAILFEAPLEERLARAGRMLGIDIHLMSGQAGHS